MRRRLTTERGATQVVQTMLKRSRAPVVLAILAVCLALVGVVVWANVGTVGHPKLAFGIIIGLALVELLLVGMFFRQKPESDELGIDIVSDTDEALVLNLPDGTPLTLDRVNVEIVADNGNMRIPCSDVHFLQVENARDVRVLAATGRDLMLLAHLVRPPQRARAEVMRTVRRFARSAAVPFEET